MELADFQEKVINQLKMINPNIMESRILSHYEDLLYIASLCDEIAATIPNNLPSQKVKRERQLIVMLKALYMFANIFIDVFLSEAVKKESYNKFINNMPFEISNDVLLYAHRIVIYRNKIIAHHDKHKKRMYGFSVTAGGEKRLTTIPPQFIISKKNIVELNKLKNNYESTITELSNANNQFMQLQILFNRIPPIGSDREINPDRKEIDKIVGHGGVESMTYLEVLEAVNTFTMAIVEKLSQKD